MIMSDRLTKILAKLDLVEIKHWQPNSQGVCTDIDGLRFTLTGRESSRTYRSDAQVLVGEGYDAHIVSNPLETELRYHVDLSVIDLETGVVVEQHEQSRPGTATSQYTDSEGNVVTTPLVRFYEGARQEAQGYGSERARAAHNEQMACGRAKLDTLLDG
jgi:hypothetical protein